jgi:2-keto-4-pentenoate hydratase/2-oxohepta-3-ene-1,7-dioic acid hydratase in catechol pathway
MSKIVRVEKDGCARWGRVEDGAVIALSGDPFPEFEAIGETLGSISELRVLAPARPTKIICVGRNYVAHAAEHGAEVPQKPLLFTKPPSSVIASGDHIVLPPESQRVEHEGELALVIGRRCRRISEDEAWDAVFGVTCADDVTARDLQRAENQWTRGKGFDTFCPVGPWIVTGLDREVVADLGIRCSVNGETRQQGRTSEMVFSPEFLVSYISQVMTLEPGDLILTGTPAGVGPLAPGDQVTVEIEDVGLLTNPVIAEQL